MDFILGQAEIAIEVKISEQVHATDLKGLIAFGEEHPHARKFVVSQDKEPRKLEFDKNSFITICLGKIFYKTFGAVKLFD